MDGQIEELEENIKQIEAEILADQDSDIETEEDDLQAEIDRRLDDLRQLMEKQK